jgi:hypothetical protein
MLLFLLREFREPSDVPRSTLTTGGYAAELFTSGLFLSTWSVLRLFSAHGENFAVDRALALPCLALGLWVALRSLRSLVLDAGHGRSRKKKGLHIAKRAQRRRQRVERVKGRSWPAVSRRGK